MLTGDHPAATVQHAADVHDPADTGHAHWKVLIVMTGRFPDPTSLAELLTVERARTLNRVEVLTHDRDRVIESSAPKGVVDEHGPEGAATDFERSQIEVLLDQARRHLSDYDRALRRLDQGQYGMCESCGRPIDPERLAARPEASTCITCAAAR
jgi:RNA polymerase-binding transcription factor DksA